MLEGRRHSGLCCKQAMAAATQRLVDGPWAGGGPRDVYADFNALTLDIVTEVLFGWDIAREQASLIVGAQPFAHAAALPGCTMPAV